MKRSGLILASLLLPVALAVVLAGCQTAGHEVRYEVRVTQAVLESDAPASGADAQEIALETAWTVTSGELSARVTNPADSLAVILWDAARVSYGGDSVEALVSKAPHQSPDVPQPPTEIPPRGQMVIGMLPETNAEWEWLPNRAMGGAWRSASGLFGITLDSEQSEDDRRALAETAVGRKIVVDLTVRTGTRVLRYIYDMRVTGAEVRTTYH